MSERAVLSVSELSRRLAAVLEERFPAVWVEGEISNFKVYGSGHAYFTLKDEGAQLRAVLFRNRMRRIRFEPTDGLHVVAFGAVEAYPQRGEYQLVVELLEPRGLGALQLAFEQLKERLGREGLFNQARKRPLPRFPRKIGIVTSPRGAALHDMLRVIGRRFGEIHVVVAPARVQGEGAAAEVAQGIRELNALGGVEVIIIGRGGGSLEDLWAFNDEMLARTIAASKIPVVSAVGHEVDFTIADFVADARAPTPTAAAALVVPDRAEMAESVARAGVALRAALRRRAGAERDRIAGLRRRLGDPERRVAEVALRVDDLAERARHGLTRRVAWERRELATLAARLERGGPAPGIRRARERLAAGEERLRFALAVRVRHARAAVEQAAGRLDALSPLACLARGYAIVRRGDATGPVVRDAAALAAGDAVALVFARGRARARIDATETETEG